VPRQANSLLLSSALRGLLVGLAACAVFALSILFTSSSLPTAQSGAVVLTTMIGIGLPVAFIAGTIVAWLVKLPRPWLISLAGLALTLILACTIGWLANGVAWIIPALIMLASYATTTALLTPHPSPTSHTPA
jgi:hypothetical protein